MQKTSYLQHCLLATYAFLSLLRCSNSALADDSLAGPVLGGLARHGATIRLERGEGGFYYANLLLGQPQQKVKVLLATAASDVLVTCAPAFATEQAFAAKQSRTAELADCKECAGECGSTGACEFMRTPVAGAVEHGYYVKDVAQLGDAWGKKPVSKLNVGCRSKRPSILVSGYQAQQTLADMEEEFTADTAYGVLGLVAKPTKFDLVHSPSNIEICLGKTDGLVVVSMANEPLPLPPTVHFHQHALSWTNLVIEVGNNHGDPSGYLVRIGQLFIDGEDLELDAGWAALDSTSSHSFLGNQHYLPLRRKIEEYVSNQESIVHRQGDCWELHAIGDLDLFPSVTASVGSFPVIWEAKDYLTRTDPVSLDFCYNFAEGAGNPARPVLGLDWMMNKRIQVDFWKEQIGFASADCPSFDMQSGKVDTTPSTPSATSRTTSSTTRSTSTTTVTTTTTSTTSTTSTTAPEPEKESRAAAKDSTKRKRTERPTTKGTRRTTTTTTTTTTTKTTTTTSTTTETRRYPGAAIGVERPAHAEHHEALLPPDSAAHSRSKNGNQESPDATSVERANAGAFGGAVWVIAASLIVGFSLTAGAAFFAFRRCGNDSGRGLMVQEAAEAGQSEGLLSEGQIVRGSGLSLRPGTLRETFECDECSDDEDEAAAGTAVP